MPGTVWLWALPSEFSNEFQLLNRVCHAEEGNFTACHFTAVPPSPFLPQAIPAVFSPALIRE
jgi:hypothetical protein